MKSFNEYIIDSKVLRNNVANIKKSLKSNVKFCAVVKANAYGLGIRGINDIIGSEVDYFAVACLNEAIELRLFNKKAEILVLGVVDCAEFDFCIKNNINISIGCFSQLKNIKDANLKFHLQVNTGLNRYGFKSITEFNRAINYINKNNLNLKGVYSHLATKSKDVQYMNKQLIRFNQFKKLVKNKDVIFHIANSYATVYDKKFQLDMVRNGFLMYGDMKNTIGNKCVLTIKSKIINLFDVKKGETVGYDRNFKATKKITVGVVSLGYADGFDRRLSNNFSVLVNGYKCKVIGNVCMDVFMIDLSEASAKIGDEVVILGCQKNKKITLNDYALALNTSPYEILLKFNYKRMNYIIR
ncbi:MAG: alanine racemase [Clostridiales bacterium]|nr:alanine racemase [Clostridiales bacterium]